MTKNEWIWMPHPGHFFMSDRCAFHLTTYVGKYIVSTVGELRGELEFTEIGCDRLYETKVFEAKESKNECCPYRIIVEKDVDFRGYNKDADARKGHLELCEKWKRHK